MAAAQRSKASDKQDSCKKLLAILKKHYPAPPRPPELPVLETMIYASCLENASFEDAARTYDLLLKSFHDLNEIRVSSIDELEAVFHDVSDAEWRAMRIRGLLQHLFESTYTFECDGIKRKTLDLATKQLSKIKMLSPFARAYTLQQALGAHVLPIDDRMHAALVWLGLSTPDQTPEQTGEGLRGSVRKADAQEFCDYLRRLATDPAYVELFAAAAVPPPEDEEPEELDAPPTRLQQLLKGEFSTRSKKPPSKKAAAPAPTAKSTPRKKAAPAPEKKPKGDAKKRTSAAAKPTKTTTKKPTARSSR